MFFETCVSYLNMIYANVPLILNKLCISALQSANFLNVKCIKVSILMKILETGTLILYGEVPACVKECISLHCISSLKLLLMSFPQSAYINYKLGQRMYLFFYIAQPYCKINTIAGYMQNPPMSMHA